MASQDQYQCTIGRSLLIPLVIKIWCRSMMPLWKVAAQADKYRSHMRRNSGLRLYVLCNFSPSKGGSGYNGDADFPHPAYGNYPQPHSSQIVLQPFFPDLAPKMIQRLIKIALNLQISIHVGLAKSDGCAGEQVGNRNCLFKSTTNVCSPSPTRYSLP